MVKQHREILVRDGGLLNHAQDNLYLFDGGISAEKGKKDSLYPGLWSVHSLG